MRCGSHAAADRFPVFWGLDLKWTAWYTEIRPIILTINFDLRKIQIASNLPERNYCAVEGVCVCVCVCVCAVYPPRINKCDHGPTDHTWWH